MKKLLCLIGILAMLACLSSAQTATPPVASALANVALPTYVMAGASFNQLTGGAGFVSAIVAESQSVGLYGSVTTDLVPLKTTINGKSIYLLSGSVRAGEHKVLYNGPKNMLLIGGDAGASFNNSSSPGISVGIAGSFTLTYIFKFNAHWAAALPIRMLYMSNVGPNGSGAWNPVVEVGVVWHP